MKIIVVQITLFILQYLYYKRERIIQFNVVNMEPEELPICIFKTVHDVLDIFHDARTVECNKLVTYGHKKYNELRYELNLRRSLS